nr:MAG TPA: hypothetical protein [Caudoviricetes sp.]
MSVKFNTQPRNTNYTIPLYISGGFRVVKLFSLKIWWCENFVLPL